MKKTKFLATTALDKFWNKNEEILFLGEWCKIYKNKDIYKKLNSETLDFIWGNYQEIDQAWTYHDSLYPQIILNLTKVLNKYHSVNKSIQYWDILLRPWLTRYIQILYDKYRHIKFAQEKYTIYTYTLKEQNYQYINTTHSFINNIEMNDEYNLQIYSQIIKFLKIKHLDKEDSISKLDTRIIIQSSYWSKKAKKLSLLINKKYKHSNNIVVVNPYFKFDFWKNLKKLAIKTKMKYYFNDFQYDININKKIALYARKSIFQNNSDEKFEALLYQTFEYNFPIIFLEGYKEFDSKVKNLNIEVPTAIVTANSIHYNEIFRFYLSNNITKTKFFQLQHGGGYGINKVTLAEEIERTYADKFFTFGWDDYNNTKPISMPKYKFNKNITNNQITLILTTMSRYPNGLNYNESSSKMLDSLENTKQFLNNLTNISNLTIREFPIEFGWDIKQRLLSSNKQLYFNNNINYYTQITNSKLNIYNHMHTGYLESLSMNIPTIIIIPKDVYYFRDSSKPFIQMLIDNNILYYNPLDAAKFTNKIQNNIESWWLSSNVQDARKRFCHQYMRTSNNWEDSWIKELK